jgi:hypothetical protein
LFVHFLSITFETPDPGVEGVSWNFIHSTGAALSGSSGSFEVETGVATEGNGGKIHFEVETGAITLPSHLPHTTAKASEEATTPEETRSYMVKRKLYFDNDESRSQPESSDAPPDESLERTNDRNLTRLSWKVRIRLARQGVEGNVTLTRKSKPNPTPKLNPNPNLNPKP